MLRGQLRGIFATSEEPTISLRYGVQVFETPEEAKQWTIDASLIGSNPDFPLFFHNISILVTEDSCEENILKIIRRYRKAALEIKKFKDNVVLNSSFIEYSDFKPIVQSVRASLDLSFFQDLNDQSTMNTFKYMFNHLRNGIFVSIRNNELKMFLPFANKDYRNTWSRNLSFSDHDNFTSYQQTRETYFGREFYYKNKENWWNDGFHLKHSIFPQIDSDEGLLEQRHMIESLCSSRTIPDTDFFINRNRHPCLKKNSTKPFDFLYTETDTPLEKDLQFQSHAPVLSTRGSAEYADILFPTVADWSLTVGKYFPPSGIRDPDTNEIPDATTLFASEQFGVYSIPWEQKLETVFFRGSATGAGTTTEDNQRLLAADICYEWASTGSNTVLESDNVKTPQIISLLLLDVGITDFVTDNRKSSETNVNYVKADEFIFERSNYVPHYESSKYKYLLYIEGNGASSRYSSLMKLNSVIFRVESTSTASELWFFPALIPYVGNRDNNLDVRLGGADHIPIKPDLSNLREMILWCKDNDDKCKIIAANAFQRQHHLLSRDSILDYLQMTLVEISRKHLHLPMFFVFPENLKNNFKGERAQHCTKDMSTNERKYCRGCRERQQEFENRRLRRRQDVDNKPSLDEHGKKRRACRKCRKTRCSCKPRSTNKSDVKRIKIKLGNTSSKITIN